MQRRAACAIYLLGVVAVAVVILVGCGGHSDRGAPDDGGDPQASVGTLRLVFIWPQPGEMDTEEIPDATQRIAVQVVDADSGAEVATGEVKRDDIVDDTATLELEVPPGQVNVWLTAWDAGGREIGDGEANNVTIVAGQANQVAVTMDLVAIISVTPAELVFQVGEAEKVVAIRNAGNASDQLAWQLQADEDWVSFDQDHGVGEADVTVAVDRGQLGTADKARHTCTITLRSTDYEQVLQVDVTVYTYAGGVSKIAFVRDGKIWLAEPDWTNVTELCDGQRPSWSFDSDRIVYERDARVCRIGANGTGQSVLARSAGHPSPQWCPVNDLILFEEHSEDSDAIFVMRADGTGRREVAHAESDPFGSPYTHPVWRFVGDAVWSPNGAKIAYLSWEESPGHYPSYDVHVVNPDGTGHQMLWDAQEAVSVKLRIEGKTSTSIRSHTLCWSPDSSEIAVTYPFPPDWPFTSIIVSPGDLSGARQIPLPDNLMWESADLWWGPTGLIVVSALHTSTDERFHLVLSADGSGNVQTVLPRADDGRIEGWTPQSAEARLIVVENGGTHLMTVGGSRTQVLDYEVDDVAYSPAAWGW